MDLKYIHNVETAAQQAEGFTVIFFLKLNINFKLLLEKDIVSCATHLKKNSASHRNGERNRPDFEQLQEQLDQR